jgi:serine/threonine protein phosphatase PrpC
MFGRWARRPAGAANRQGSLPITGTMATHLGYVREQNEDVVAFELPPSSNGTGNELLALVADGMGGHAAGEVASRIAADTIFRCYHQRREASPRLLRACLEKANAAIWERARRDPACAGMGTTCTVLDIREGAAFLGHIGDSRAYLWRAGRLRQLSEDHSLVAELVRAGQLSGPQAAASPDRNVILRALGIEPRCQPTVWDEGLAICPGDVFVLCSDGLSDLVDDTAIAETVARLAPFEACEALIDQALAAGGSDNVSVGVFAIGVSGPSAPPTPTRPLPTPGAGS